MSDWLQSILGEIDAVTQDDIERIMPVDGVGPKDHAVGVVDERTKKLYVLLRRYQKRMLEIQAALVDASQAERADLMKKGARIDTYFHLFQGLFWTGCKESFPELWTRESIGIRQNWQAVWTDPEPQHPLGILGALMGAGGVVQVLGVDASHDDRPETPSKQRLN